MSTAFVTLLKDVQTDRRIRNAQRAIEFENTRPASAERTASIARYNSVIADLRREQAANNDRLTADERNFDEMHDAQRRGAGSGQVWVRGFYRQQGRTRVWVPGHYRAAAAAH